MTLEKKWILFNAFKKQKSKKEKWGFGKVSKSKEIPSPLSYIFSFSESIFNEHTSSYNNEKCRLAPLKIPAQECYITSFRNTCPCHIPSPSLSLSLPPSLSLSPSLSKPQCTFHSNALTESSIRCLPWLMSCTCYTLTLFRTDTPGDTCICVYLSLVYMWIMIFGLFSSSSSNTGNLRQKYTLVSCALKNKGSKRGFSQQYRGTIMGSPKNVSVNSP